MFWTVVSETLAKILSPIQQLQVGFHSLSQSPQRRPDGNAFSSKVRIVKNKVAQFAKVLEGQSTILTAISSTMKNQANSIPSTQDAFTNDPRSVMPNQ
jgi:hypothetical protein